MTQRFIAAQRFSLVAFPAAAVIVGAVLGTGALLAPPAVAQDTESEDCGFVCGIVTEPGDDSMLADPPYPDLVGPDNLDDVLAPQPTPTLPPQESADPYTTDTDGDGVPDGYEGVDSDYDGVWDWYEIYVYGTDPYTADQPTRSGGGGDPEAEPGDAEEDCTYATPDTCFPRMKPDDDTPE